MVKLEGISGLTKLFRESLIGVPDGSNIVFMGSEAVCPPFAQLLAYAVRDRDMSFGFSPKAVWEKCRKMSWVEGAGFQISEEKFDPINANVIVVLGGLAMPKFGCQVQDVNSYISRISGRPLVVGLGFMNVFRRVGWDKQVRFDVLLDSYMSAEVL
ncbi:MAG: DUF2124 domain-containing protein [Methanomassiliicoccales archaeon]|nr:DUF2124 domain-containing protein [Methanomassiliicoccales archaeon]